MSPAPPAVALQRASQPVSLIRFASAPAQRSTNTRDIPLNHPASVAHLHALLQPYNCPTALTSFQHYLSFFWVFAQRRELGVSCAESGWKQDIAKGKAAQHSGYYVVHHGRDGRRFENNVPLCRSQPVLLPQLRRRDPPTRCRAAINPVARGPGPHRRARNSGLPVEPKGHRRREPLGGLRGRADQAASHAAVVSARTIAQSHSLVLLPGRRDEDIGADVFASTTDREPPGGIQGRAARDAAAD